MSYDLWYNFSKYMLIIYKTECKMELNLKDIMSLLLSKLLLIILAILLCADAAFAYTYFFV